MNCPFCQANTAVIDSRPRADAVTRRRKCRQCKRTFGTTERITQERLSDERVKRMVKAAVLFAKSLNATLQQLERLT